MNGWWEEQLAGYRPAAPVPAVRDSRSPATASERGREGWVSAAPQPADEWASWWGYARATAAHLALGVAPPAIDVYGPVLEDGEEAVLSADLSYSRLYGGDGRYRKADLLMVGRPAVMAAGFAFTAVVNHRRRVAAQRDAELRWRDQQRAQVITTTDRLLCNTDTGWVSGWFGSVTEFYPDVQGWSLTLGFDRGVAPLRLSGPAAPAMCVWVGACVLGDRWTSDPRLAPLLL